MLNELYTLGRSLDRFHVAVEESHPWVKPLARAEILVAGIDAAGLVTHIERMSRDDAANLFKIQQSNHANFPQVNWTAPLWQLDPKAEAVKEWLACPQNEVARRTKLLRQACESAPPGRKADTVWTRMTEFCRELLPRFRAAAEAEFAAFPVLMERITGQVPDADLEVWLRRFSEAALAAAEGGSPELLALVETLLAGKNFEEAKVGILFDLADVTRFPCREASPRMGAYFSRTLNATEDFGAADGRCALAGLEMPLERDKLPNPRLPGIGNTFLMSMNEDAPCQTRYQRIGTDIFPVGKRTAQALDTALKHFTALDREGKNWKRLSQDELLLVYLESSPLNDALVAELFSGPDETALYERVCESVGEALRGRDTKDSGLLRVLVLKKIDPGRTQVALSESFTADAVIAGGKQWVDGARNRPAIVLPESDWVPSPVEVMRCLRMSWERSGTSFSEAPGCQLADVYEVLIADRPRGRDAAAQLLRLTLQRSSVLLMALGHTAHRRDQKAREKVSKEVGRSVVVAVSLMGIALSKFGIRKESYMEDAAFLIGRFLSLADTLHAQYSQEVRDGKMPPQLLGNALMPTAIRDPQKGLARMRQRLAVYQAWARGPKGTGLAKWSLAEMGKVANEMKDKLPTAGPFNEAEQAQVLLGYLARAEKANDDKGDKHNGTEGK
jgi:hypothetical protein